MRVENQTAQQTSSGEILLEGRGINKGFPGVWEDLILEDINFDVRAGEVHTLLGENGAGKTVIANILSGYYSLTAGQIFVNGKAVRLKSPKDGLRHGIGMVHQETMLVRPFTVAENVMIGLERQGLSFSLRRVERNVQELSERYKLRVNPKAKVEDLSAGEQQRVEIIKVLYHKPKVILLDEPTSLLAPEEVDDLFVVLRNLANEGHGIVFISHKMREVFAISDRVTVLKLGKAIGTKHISEADEAELTRMMFGEQTSLHIKRNPSELGDASLEVDNLHVLGAEGKPALSGVSFGLRKGEILGVAGIAGNGQSELIEAITGLRPVTAGFVRILGKDMTNSSPREIIEAGVAHIPERRREIGIVEGLTVAENVMLKDYRKRPFSKFSVLNKSRISEHSQRLATEFHAIIPDLWKTESRILSGGNIQRLILGRETWRDPPLLIAAHPTEGLDARSIRQTWQLFMRLREGGSAILLVSEDLDEVLALSDRIAVMFEGEIVDIVDGASAKRREIGRLMSGTR